ncbi:RNA exonuclease 4 [Folsomia candida]|uniref:RNA exonuclease 4 n=1 Tax=Folsomia candida TaxID=158441 RepID=A0A226DLP6_FOLCA|nr:RNA exonuclease 4 [Folsomia candida]XP_035713090.1 RNA exonuclease 4 [Folsomia candida]OXA46050.1 RNA exonuclease 4 [Folsomia candida]
MDEFNIQEVVNWTCSTDRDSRLNLLKILIRCTPHDELKIVQRFVDNAKKRKSPNKHLSKKKRHAVGKEVVGVVAQMSTTVAQMPTTPPPTSWWEEVGMDGFVSLDCEMVTLNQKNSHGKFIQKAATVGIVDWKKDTILNETVYHKAGSYKVNSYTKKINGFEGSVLEKGRELSAVKEQTESIIEGKVVVTAGGASDLLSLGLVPSDYELFDIQTVFRKWSGQFTKAGDKVYQPINLRSLYFHYFGEDIQSGIHSSLTDARATMRLFQEIYLPLALAKNPFSRSYEIEDGEFDNIKKI